MHLWCPASSRRATGACAFPEPLEAEFRRDHLLGSRRWVRLSLFVAFATSAGYAVIDPWIVHAAAPLTKIVRFGVQLPALLVILLATFERFYARWYELAIQIGVPVFGIGTIVVAGYAQPQYASLVGARLLLVSFYFYFMAGLRMPQALRGNLVILGALVVAAPGRCSARRPRDVSGDLIDVGQSSSARPARTRWSMRGAPRFLNASSWWKSRSWMVSRG